MIATGTEGRVCADIAARQALGMAKYGTSVESNPLSLREWLQHAYLETLDKAIYLRRAMEEMDKEHIEMVKKCTTQCLRGNVAECVCFPPMEEMDNAN